MTVRRLATGLLLAVFFSTPILAVDSTLFCLESGLNNLIYKLSRSVVTIEAWHPMDMGHSGRLSDLALQNTVSSGLIIDSAGHLLVSAVAVVGKEKITVTFDNRVLTARLVATDYQSGLSLLEVTPCCGRPVEISNRQSCAGQMVVALGNAYGVRAAPSMGFCAGVREDGTMQFSVAVASGAIGGGIFDLSGRLLGIISGDIGTDRRMTLAVPAYRLPEIAKYLLAKGDRYSGFIGFATREIEIDPGIPIPYPTQLTTAGSRSHNVIERGIIITSVQPGSPAYRARLIAGDLVFAVNGIPVNSAAGLARMVRLSTPGRVLKMELLRRHQYLAVAVQIGRKSLDEISTPRGFNAASDDAYRIDSLQQALQLIRDDLIRLERNLPRRD